MADEEKRFKVQLTVTIPGEAIVYAEDEDDATAEATILDFSDIQLDEKEFTVEVDKVEETDEY